MSSTSEGIVARGKLFELVHIPQPDGRVFEIARRAPGVRLIIVDQANRKLLLTREFRSEHNGYDYRLPGGKVFDTLADYAKFRETKADIVTAATAKAVAEAREEAGLVIRSPRLYRVSRLGATVEWDLYVFEVTDWQRHDLGQALEAGEDIEADHWVNYAEATAMAMDGHMQEDRIAMVLLQWLDTQEPAGHTARAG
jgi:ADP-ribose pyrophosphatase